MKHNGVEGPKDLVDLVEWLEFEGCQPDLAVSALLLIAGRFVKREKESV